MRRIVICLWLLGLVGGACPAHARAVDVEGKDREDGAWEIVPEAELAGLRGGFRIGRLRLAIAFRLRHRVDGREVFSSELRRHDGSAAPELEPVVSVDVGSGEVQLRQAQTPTGVRLIVANSADGVSVRTEGQLDIRVRNFSEVFGSLRQRTGRSVARSLAVGGGLR